MYRLCAACIGLLSADFSTVNTGFGRPMFWKPLCLLSTPKQFGTQVKFRWSRDHNNRTADNAFSAPWYYSEMELEPAAG